MMIESMGFTAKQAKRALRKCDNNMERACDWIFSHIEEPDSDEEMQVDQSSQMDNQPNNLFKCDQPLNGQYSFQSFITHLGTSVFAGHYVCHIKKDDKWIYFNDAKVAETPEPPFGKGFIYLMSKKL